MEVLHRDAERFGFVCNRIRLGEYGDIAPAMPALGTPSRCAGTIEENRRHASTPAQSRDAIGRYQRTRAGVERNIRRHATNYDFANAAIARL